MKLKLPGGLGRRQRVDDDLPALEQIDELTRQNRERRHDNLERELVRARHRAFFELDRSPPAETPPESMEQPPAEANEFGSTDGLPTVDVERLDAATIRAAFLSGGALLVRGLLSPERAGGLRESLDRAFDNRDAFIGGAKVGETSPWFHPFKPAPEYAASGEMWNRHVEGGGSVWAVDSPRVMFELLDAFEEVGVPRIAQEYLGERPAFSMKKAVLRRVAADSGAAWHQDGAFLGDDIRTLNIWVALTRCGDEAPGMDIVAERLREILPTGTEGATFDWSVSDEMVQEQLGEKIVRPIFNPGDALLFDHMNLHRTAADPQMPNLRYATETWCFAPSTYPEKQIPIVV